MSFGGWIGVDLDGTLAFYDKWKGVDHIGEPVTLMVARVKSWLAEGIDVRIMTARVSGARDDLPQAVRAIEQWCLLHLGKVLPITHEKDFSMIELWDDRVVPVEKNTGVRLSPAPELPKAPSPS